MKRFTDTKIETLKNRTFPISLVKNNNFELSSIFKLILYNEDQVRQRKN